MYHNIKNIFIVIPVHNRKQFTRDCLLSLRKQTFKKNTTIVIDDGSSDGTSEMIQKEYPEIILLHGDGNLWWTGAINLGVRYALENATQGDYILTMNDDTIIRPNYLKALIECASKHPRSLIGSIALNSENEEIMDGGVKINWYTAKFNFLGRGNEYKILVNKEPPVIPVDVLSGRGTLIPLEVFQEIGLYDFVNLPHYGADYELSRRAKKCGYNLYISYRAIVFSNLHSPAINYDFRNLTWVELTKGFFSIRSPYNLRYRWNFARLTSPKWLLLTFYFFDIGRVVCSFLLNKIRMKLKHR